MSFNVNNEFHNRLNKIIAESNDVDYILNKITSDDIDIKVILEEISIIISEIEEKHISMHINSLYFLLYIIPFIKKINHSIYFDKEIGLFGVMFVKEIKHRDVLNIVFSSNKELIFSYITRKNGINKISGAMHIDDLESIEDINLILDMIR